MECRVAGEGRMARRSLLLGAAAPLLTGQSRVVARSEYIGRSAFPNEVRRQLERLGDRLLKEGKERVHLVGTFADGTGAQSPAQAIYQLPSFFRFQATGPAARTVVFDGETPRSARAQLERVEEDLLETFLADSADGFFEGLRAGDGLRMLGRGFRPDPALFPNYTGPRYDIYEVVGAARTRRDRRRRLKRFYFDSASALMMKVRYFDGARSPSVVVESRFREWRDVTGNPAPGVIERWEDGRLAFSFRVSAGAVLAKGDDRIFREPGA